MFVQSNHSLDSTQKEDNELWLTYLEGQQKALGRIFLRHYSRLYQYGIKLIRNETFVEDGIQELFLKLWTNRTKVNKAHSVEFYLLYSLRRILLRQKEQSISFDCRNGEYAKEYSSSFQSAEAIIIFNEEKNERYQLFIKAQEYLTSRQKEILYLRLHHGMTNSEISIFLNISEQRVKNCIYESIKLLKERIHQSFVERPVE